MTIEPMFSGAPLADVLAARPELVGAVDDLRARARAATPGRTALVVESRVRQLLLGEPPLDRFDREPAEAAVVALTEQFLVDAHGVDDSLTDALRSHYTPAEIVAICFHLALTDGFTRLERVAVPSVPTEPEPR